MKVFSLFVKTAVFGAILVSVFFSMHACRDDRPRGDAEPAAVSGKGEDLGGEPWVMNIETITLGNAKFRATRWTGKYMQMTLMSIKPGGEIGQEMHDDIDQFIRVEQGKARVLMGKSKDNMSFSKEVGDDWAIFIPAGYWHNVLNIGKTPLKVYSIYSPAEHPAGTVHETFEESEAAHHHH